MPKRPIRLKQDQLDQYIESHPELTGKIIELNPDLARIKQEETEGPEQSSTVQHCSFCTRPRLPGNWIELTVLALIGGAILIWALLA